MSIDEEIPAGPGFERTPPHNIEAEQSVLGGMLLSKDAIADVVEIIRADDFYRPAHQMVYEVITDLYGRGEPADAVTVFDELQKRGEMARVGGAAYLHTLTAVVPTAANAGYYAKIVREQAILRRLIEAGTRIVSYGYGGQNEEVDDLVDRAQAEIYKVTERRTSEDYAPLADIMPGALDELEAIGSRGGQMVGVPTGFQDLDQLTNGLHPGQMIVVAARPAIGKALALDTPLPTPDGWTTMGDVKVGDRLIGADGRPTRIVAATEVMHGRPCYEVEFSDGTVIVADAQHQWRTITRAQRKQRRSGPSYHWAREAVEKVRIAYEAALGDRERLVTHQEALQLVGEEFRHVLHVVQKQVGMADKVVASVGGAMRSYEWRTPAYRAIDLFAALHARVTTPKNATITAVPRQTVTTEEIAATLRTSDGRPNHAVAVTAPFDLDERALPLAPYALGIWLGDGHSAGARISTADPEVITNLEAEGLCVTRVGSSISYQLTLPAPDSPAGRTCVVCGQEFVPRTSQVRTCGRSCGGRARFVSAPVPVPTCPDCGAPTSGLRRCQACHRSHGTVQGILRTLGVLHDKHIPAAYLRGSEGQRRALLAGLLDSDGHVNTGGQIQFAVTNRRLAADVHELILSLGYKATMRTKQVRGRSADSSTVYMINFTASDKLFRLPRKAIRQTGEARPSTRLRYIVDVRAIASRPVRCVQVDNDDHMYLAGRTCIPTHNSTLGLDFARSAAIKNGMTTVIFSLEMSRNEITMRLLSAEARVALHAMRSGMMSDEDWTRLARRMSEVAEAPLFIDDSPNMSMMEIRAKCRRLKQRNDLRFVVIDYLQLMSSPKKTESRQNEVSEISRAIKLLAKELEVPVIAISQLNRGPEQRTDKRPQVSDLRESGCLTAGTRVLRADTGAETSLGELLESGARDIPVWSLDEKLRLVPRTMTHVFPSGTKEVFLLRLSSGREIEATANHPFMTFDGWRPLGELAPGARVAAPRHVSAPRGLQEWPDDQVTLHAHLAGEGGAVPEGVFSLPKRQIALFLRGLWASGGQVGWDDEVGEARLSCTSTSRRLVDDVARLLLRFNVMTRIEEVRQAHRLWVTGADNQLRFLDDIGVAGERFEPQAGRCAAALRRLVGDTGAGAVPRQVWDLVGDSLAVRGATKGAPGPERLRRISTILDDADLELLATNDVFWDEVASVESLGEQPVYDATVLGTHNFVANGISVHNSIEQDADMVILLHREDAYERESPRAGEADLIVAKHRNGPTATVTVAFQGHYSRFVDMAQH
ncbi:replicative DNA helicase [Nonomuraea wenchangensis]|uniref:Replicative DNA helicase n=1 Tax=Nonomuraea wenchangensis TaxID=568860 RepID=A0A1I0L2R9_9ACTN|nr:replicative DNA helicase [Nonomuraea wenchangensis]SEU33716.1 replicative DNA helicase [Nonomuraea wenchangensis]